MATRRKRRWALRLAAAAFMVALSLFPLPVRDHDREVAIRHSVQSLLQQRRVLLDGNFVPFYDSKLMATQDRQWHCLNDTDLDLTFVEKSGIRAITGAQREALVDPGWYSRNAMIEVTYRDVIDENGDRLLRFNVYQGPLAAQGYQVTVHRCILGVFARYECEWVS